MNTQYMKLGSQAMAFGPLAGGIGMAAGLGADLLMNQQAQQDQLATMKKDSLDPTYTQANPYAGQGYGQNLSGKSAFQPSLVAFSGLRMGGAVPYADNGKKHRQYSDGGPVGHVIPANKVGKAMGDAQRIGLDLGANAVPGTGGPTADDVPMKQPGAQPAAVSSGEMYVHDDIFEMLARGAGMSSEGYAGKMYPNSTGGKKLALGGGLFQDGGPGGPPYADGASGPLANNGDPDISASLLNPTMNMLPRSATEKDSIGSGLPDIWDLLTQSSGNPDTPPDGVSMQPSSKVSSPEAAVGGGMANPMNLKVGGSESGAAVDTVIPKPEGEPDLQKLNRDTAIGQGIAAVGSLAYNLFRERDSIPKPEQAVFQPLDLHTESLSANLQGQRARATNTAVVNNRGDQGEGRSLGIHANNEQQAQADAMTVEGVKNQERQYNNAGQNQVGQMNTQVNNAWQTQEALVNDQFRKDKMMAVNQSLAAMSGITGDYLSNRVGLQLDAELKKFRSDYLKYLAGAKGYENMAITSLGGTV